VVKEVPQPQLLLVTRQQFVVIVIQLNEVVRKCVELEQALLGHKIILVNFSVNGHKHKVHLNLGRNLNERHFSCLAMKTQLLVKRLQLDQSLQSYYRTRSLGLFQDDFGHIEEFVICLDNSFVFAHLAVLER